MVKTKLVQEIKLGLHSLISGSSTNILKLGYNRTANLLNRYFLICREQVTKWKFSLTLQTRTSEKFTWTFGVSFKKLDLWCPVITLFFNVRLSSNQNQYCVVDKHLKRIKDFFLWLRGMPSVWCRSMSRGESPIVRLEQENGLLHLFLTNRSDSLLVLVSNSHSSSL